jgi:hypothetical protein
MSQKMGQKLAYSATISYTYLKKDAKPSGKKVRKSRPERAKRGAKVRAQKRGHFPWISAIVKVNTMLTLVIGELEMITVEEHETIRRAYYPRSEKARGRSPANRGIPSSFPSQRRECFPFSRRRRP